MHLPLLTTLTLLPLPYLTTALSPSSPTTTSTTSTPCLVTSFSQISSAVTSCTTLTLFNISVPGSGFAIDLSGLKPNSVVTFSGTTTFGYTGDSSFDPIVISGKNITVQGAEGSVIDGNGGAYWDGEGSNGGVEKPNHFIVLKKLTSGSTIRNLHIINWPVHLFSITSCSSLSISNLLLDNRAGDAPNAASGTLAAAHNSDGFDISSSSNVQLRNISVWNQDDCVAVTSGDHISVDGMYCSGGHGLSIGSVGGKSNNNVTNISFSNSIITSSTNGPRIKSNFNTTGYIANISYTNILLQNISSNGIVIQQDYLNGGPTGTPSNGVVIEGVTMRNVTGGVMKGGRNYYVLCGVGSCKGFTWDGVKISGGAKNSSCNFPAGGCPS